ncbi:hypothetical protein [Bradyrhizobium sp. 6(2017)]|uniref:hypothetical protein n=1 Tax=Bradyrhizobium sp. 6(2017) TaxID=1197460 RepID=UPI002FE53645
MKTSTQTPLQSAVAAINAKLLSLRSELRETSARIVDLEKSGIRPATTEPHDRLKQEARSLVNGASYKPAAVSADHPAIRYEQERRRQEVLKLAVEQAEQDAALASADLGREILATHDAEIKAKHRERALTLIKLMRLNDQIEEFRATLMECGAAVAHPLDGHTAKLFGITSQPSASAAGLRRYLDACVAAGVITKKELA